MIITIKKIYPCGSMNMVNIFQHNLSAHFECFPCKKKKKKSGNLQFVIWNKHRTNTE